MPPRLVDRYEPGIRERYIVVQTPHGYRVLTIREEFAKEVVPLFRTCLRPADLCSRRRGGAHDAFPDKVRNPNEWYACYGFPRIRPSVRRLSPGTHKCPIAPAAKPGSGTRCYQIGPTASPR